MANVFLDTEDEYKVEEIMTNLQKHSPSARYSHSIDKFEAGSQSPEVTVYWGKSFADLDRLDHLIFARNGSILFSDNINHSPMYAGSILGAKSTKLHASLDYMTSRVKFYNELPVNYVGRVLTDPVNVLIVDNKGYKNIEVFQDVLEVAADNWWDSIGFMSTGDSRHLTPVFDELHYSQPCAMTDAAASKLRASGHEFIDLSKIDISNKRGGLLMREATRRSEYMEMSGTQ